MKKILQKILFVLLLIPMYVYYIIKGFIIACKEPENGRSGEEIFYDMLREDKEKLEKFRKERFGK